MSRILRAVALAATAVATTLAIPSVGAAAPATAYIYARGDLAFLSGDPWRPSGPLEVLVGNDGPTAAKGYFVLRLPSGVGLARGGNCVPADGASGQSWICGGAELPPGGRRTYRLTLVSTTGEPVFGVSAWGSVAGRSADGRTEEAHEFRINWPDRLPLRLRASAQPVVDGRTVLSVRVTNAGTFTLGGYSLNVVTPDGVRVTAPACSGSGRMSGVGCEVFRSRALTAGAVDAFDLRLAVAGPTTVRLFLAPENRYTNEDTEVTLRLAGATGPTPTAPTVTPASTSPRLPVTGRDVGTYALAGAALLLLGSGLLIGRRRTSLE